MTARTVLVVEDDKTLIDVLKYNLDKEGYHVITALDGSEALEFARKHSPNLVILDIMLPKLDGFEVCRILRKEMSVPILMLTAKNSEIDKVVGLEIGADDYVTKPFSMRELIARIRAMFRRADIAPEAKTTDETSVIQIRDLSIDVARRLVKIGDTPINLTPKEFDLLAYLAMNKGIVSNREQLLEKVWGYDYPGDTRTVDVHIRWLREKIETIPGKPRYIATVRGVGYKLEG